MDNNIVNTKACKKATPNSNNKIANNGKIKIKINKGFIKNIFNINADIIFTKVWPAKILAAKRIDKLNILIKYEKISIGIKINNKKNGHSGIKILKNFILCVFIPITKIDRIETIEI